MRIKPAFEVWLLIAVVLLKLVVLLIDHRVSFYMGDSWSYLTTATTGWIPTERSYAYGFLLRPMGVWFRSLQSVVVVQTIFGALSAWIAGLIAVRCFSLSRKAATLIALLCALEPLQLLHERYIMTETAAILAFAAFALASFAFVRSGRMSHLVLAQVAGVVMISLRVAFVPLMVLNALVLPFAAWRGRRRTTLFLLVSVGLSQGLLFEYRQYTGFLSHGPPAYIYSDGFFLLSDVAPIVTPSDLTDSVKRPLVFNKDLLPLQEPSLRQAHFFDEHGLAGALRRAYPAGQDANKVANSMAIHAILHHPVNFLSLAWFTFREYMNSDQLDGWITEDQEGANIAAPKEWRDQLKNQFGYSLDEQKPTDPVRRWDRAAKPWFKSILILGLLFPLTVFFVPREWLGLHLLCALYAVVCVGTPIFVAPHATPRYLEPLAWLAFPLFAALSKLTWRYPPAGRST